MAFDGIGHKKDALFRIISEAIGYVRNADGYTDELVIESVTKHICGKVDAFLGEVEREVLPVIPVSDYSGVLDGIREFAAGRN